MSSASEMLMARVRAAEKKELALLDHENPAEIGRHARTQMLLYVLADNLPEARFLWRRTAEEVKKSSSELQTAWAVVTSLWERSDVPNGLRLLAESEWTPEMTSFVAETLEELRRREADLVGAVYTRISLKDLATALFLPEDQTLALCQQRHWPIEEAIVKPKRHITPDDSFDGTNHLNNIAAILTQLTTDPVPDLTVAH